MKLLENKVALVTGAARGIGRAIADSFAEQGARVVIGDVLSREARAAADAIKSSGGSALGITLDVSEPESVHNAMDLLLAEFGRLDVLVNNAAIMRTNYVVDIPIDEWRWVFSVNAEGTFLCSQAAVRQMIKQGSGGCIVNVASASARKADLKHAAYSSSKAAVISFTRILALEVGQHGIRVNAILPGATETEMIRDVFEHVPGIKEDLLGKTTLGKLAIPRDQANAAVFLASDMASHITGEYLVVSGGEFMNA
jgi:NAD(P)-dependent dehydrogenase (short-subunit alcohol dehydrogenase family)